MTADAFVQDTVSTDISQAIDQVTVLKIELHRLRQHLDAGDEIELLILDNMEHAIARIGQVLIVRRDRELEQPTCTPSLASNMRTDLAKALPRRRPKRSADGPHHSCH